MDFNQRIYLLGGLHADPALALTGSHPKRLLIFFLVYPNQAHGRAHLAAQLWPELDPGRGRRALSDALYRLRQTIPSTWLDVQNETIAFTPPPDLWVDLWAFTQTAVGDDMTMLAEAAALYQGDLTPEFDDDWLWTHREALRERVTAVCFKLAEAAEAAHQFDLALTYYRRLADMDDMNEAAQRGLMRCLAGQHRFKEALTSYQAFQHFLAQELSVAPAEDTQQLARQLQAEWELRQQPVGSLVITPFVGRTMERARLLARLDEARSGRGGGLVVLLGEAGIGKTRLLESLAQSADWRGWQVAWGRSEEFALPQPYAPLAAALTAVLPRPRLQQLGRLVPPWWLALAARVVPALYEALDLPAVPETPRLEQQLPLALRALMAGLQQIAPHLLILDDTQWADPAVWPLLTGLQPALADMPVLVVISGRADRLQNQPSAWEALQAWEKAGALVLHLAGLEPQALMELARAMGRGLSTAELARLHQLSEGNPLIALGLLETEAPVTAVDQPQLHHLQQQRLADLEAAAVLVLQAAAVLGYRFDYALWETVVTGIHVTDLPALAGELERRRLLILDTDGYRFHHDSLRACVYQDIPAARRPLLHQRALFAYAQFRPHATLALLYHAQAGGVTTAVGRYALQAGQEALERFVYYDAIAYFTQALAHLPADSLADRYEASLGQVRAKVSLVDNTGLAQDLVHLQAAADQLADPRRQIAVFRYQAEFAWNSGDQEKAKQLAQQGVALARQLQDIAAEAGLLETLGRIARNQGDYRQAQTWITEAQARYQAAGDRFGQASTLDKLGNLAYEAGDHAAAAAAHQQAARFFQQLGAVVQEGRSLSGEAMALRALGDYDQSRQTHHKVLSMAREMGDRYMQWVQLVLLGNAEIELGAYDTAVAYYLEALPLIRQLNNPRDLSMTLNNLGEAYREKGEPETALTFYAEGLHINQARGYQRGEAHSLNGMGLAWLDQQQPATARQLLVTARERWQALGERLKMTETMAGLALVDVAEGQREQARETIQASLALLDEHNDHPFWRRWAHYAAYCVWQAAGERDTAVTHLCLAMQAVEEIAAKLPASERTRFWQQVQINQRLHAALLAHAVVQPARLVKTEVPLGQPLMDADYVNVTWTVYLPTDVAVPDGPERRRHVLKRLLKEAAAQNAAPTDADLAVALQTSRRTILRDMQVLAAKGVTLPTRRRA